MMHKCWKQEKCGTEDYNEIGSEPGEIGCEEGLDPMPEG